MGLFDKIKNELGGKNTKGFYFGHTEAEGENKSGIQNLNNYFEDYLNVLPQVQNEKFIFTGRKGVGKSAIAKFIKDSSDKESDSFADIIKYNDIELEQITQKIPIEDKDNIELLIFEWLILVRIVKLLIKSEFGIRTKEHIKLKDFLDRNTGFAEIDKHHINEIVDKKNFDVSFDVLRHVFPTTIGKYFETRRSKAPFYKFVNPLKEIVEKILKYDVYKNNEYIILFDDLDIKFKADNSSSKDKLLSLLRATKNLNTGIFRASKTKVLIFLRNDIKSILETRDSDTSKFFSSYNIPLNWYDHYNFKIDENQVKLKQFANKRIGLNFKSNNISYNDKDPWGSLFKSDNHFYNSKSSFKYFIDFTFYRPRDIVLFLSEIGNYEYSYPLESKVVKILIQKFIQANVKELKSEFCIHFSEIEIENLFLALKSICSSGAYSREKVLKIFKEKLPNINENKVLELMLEYSVLILKDSDDHLFFNYRDNYETVDFDSMSITTHKAIFKYFNPN